MPGMGLFILVNHQTKFKVLLIIANYLGTFVGHTAHSVCELCLPFVKSQAVKIRRDSDAFSERVDDFRRFFLRTAPFAVSNFIPGAANHSELKLEMVKPAYNLLDQFHHGSVQ